MSLGKAFAIVLGIVFLIVVVVVGMSFAFKAISRQAEKQTLAIGKSIQNGEQQKDLDRYRIYLQGKDSDSIYVYLIDEPGSDYQVSINGEKFPWGKFFSLKEGILMEIKDPKNNEVKKVDIANCFKAGDILRFTYEDNFLYLFIQTFQNGGFENNWMRIKI